MDGWIGTERDREKKTERERERGRDKTIPKEKQSGIETEIARFIAGFDRSMHRDRDREGRESEPALKGRATGGIERKRERENT